MLSLPVFVAMSFCRVLSLGSRARDQFRVGGSGFRLWGCGFGVQGLGFRVLGC